MNPNYFFLAMLGMTCTILNTQQSSVRPRVQLAQTKTDLDSILSILHVSTPPQAHQAIRQLQGKVATLEQKNAQLMHDLEKEEHLKKELKEHAKKLAHTQGQVEKLKNQLGSQKERIKKVLAKFDYE